MEGCKTVTLLGEFMQYEPIRAVCPGPFNSETAQTPGSHRLAAVLARAGIDSPMYGGVFSAEPAAHTAIHHHGEQDTIAYVLSGSSYVRWGKRGCAQGAGLLDGTTKSRHILDIHGFPTLEITVTIDPVPMGKWFDPETDLTLIDPTIR
jgi:hypothetical protein